MGRAATSRPRGDWATGNYPRDGRTVGNRPRVAGRLATAQRGAGRLAVAHGGVGWLLAAREGWTSLAFLVLGRLLEPPVLFFTWNFRQTGPLLAR